MLYNFAYITSTVERNTSTTHFPRHRDDDNNHHFRRVEHSQTDTTRHWFEYRAYFFHAGE